MRIPIFSKEKHSLVSLLLVLLMIVISSLGLWAQDESDYKKDKRDSVISAKEEFVNKKLGLKTRRYIT